MFLGIPPENGSPEASVDTEAEALAIFLAADSNDLGVDMLKAQLLASKLNALKYSAFADSYLPDGQKVGDVMALADEILDDLAHGIDYDKGTMVIVKDLLDMANNNGEGQQVLRTCTFPPPTTWHSPTDYDGDGFANEAEGWYIGTNSMRRCGLDWPADLWRSGGSADTLDIYDIVSFIGPVRRLGTDPGDANFNRRWDLAPNGGFGSTINILDLTTLLGGETAYPPMFDGQRAFDRSCTP